MGNGCEKEIKDILVYILDCEKCYTGNVRYSAVRKKSVSIADVLTDYLQGVQTHYSNLAL